MRRKADVIKFKPPVTPVREGLIDPAVVIIMPTVRVDPGRAQPIRRRRLTGEQREARRQERRQDEAVNAIYCAVMYLVENKMPARDLAALLRDIPANTSQSYLVRAMRENIAAAHAYLSEFAAAIKSPA